MGSQMSQTNGSNTTGHRLPHPPPPSESPPYRINSETSSSSNGRAEDPDPDLRALYSILQTRTSRGIDSIAVGVDFHPLSFESLNDVSERLLEMNQQLVKIILQNKNKVWENKEFCDLINDYFENSLLALDLWVAVDAFQKRASHIESILYEAYKKFEEERHTVRGPGTNYSRALEELKNLKMVGNPFTQEFDKFFNSVYSQELSVLERLQSNKRKLENKLNKLRWWKLYNVRDLRGQMDIITLMHFATHIIILNLDETRARVFKLQVEIDSVWHNADFANKDVYAAELAVRMIKGRLDLLMDSIHGLSDLAKKCTRKTRMSRTLTLRKLINYSI